MLEKVATAFVISCMFLGIGIMAIITSGFAFGLIEALF